MTGCVLAALAELVGDAGRTLAVATEAGVAGAVEWLAHTLPLAVSAFLSADFATSGPSEATSSSDFISVRYSRTNAGTITLSSQAFSSPAKEDMFSHSLT